MFYYKGHPVLLAVCICFFLTLFIASRIYDSMQVFHIVTAIDDLKRSAGKDEDVMSITWCHRGTDGFKQIVVCEVSQLAGETAAETETRFDDLYDILILKRPRNCE